MKALSLFQKASLLHQSMIQVNLILWHQRVEVEEGHHLEAEVVQEDQVHDLQEEVVEVGLYQ